METLNLTSSKNESSTVQNAKAFGISKARLVSSDIFEIFKQF